MLLMVEKSVIEGKCYASHWLIKIKKHSINYWDVNNLNGQTVSQKLPVDWFKWVENTSKFCKKFIKNYNDLPFLPDRMKI